MELLFLGTGAADFPPEMGQNPLYEIENKSIRRSSSTLLDGKLLLDCGLHTADCAEYFGVDAEKIEALLLTHLHGDHFWPDAIRRIAEKRSRPLPIYFSDAGKASMPEIPNTVAFPTPVGTTFTVGEYQITSLPANHTAFPCHYSIESGDKKLFYGLDGAWLCFDTFYAMRKKKYDVMILDATVGDYEGDFRLAEHNSIPMIRMMEKSFPSMRAADEHTKIVLDHLARTLHKSYEETVEIAAKDGYIVAYDGMKLEF